MLVNMKKRDKIGDRQRDMAGKFYEAGLLSRKGLEAVMEEQPLCGYPEIVAAMNARARLFSGRIF